MLQEELKVSVNNSTSSPWNFSKKFFKSNKFYVDYLKYSVSFDQSNVFIYKIIHSIINEPRTSEAYQLMLASEEVLKKEWDTPEEDEAWQDLLKEP